MTLKERIKADFLVAYKAKDMDKKNFLSVVLGSLQTQEGKLIESTDENVLKVIKSMEKGIHENIEGRLQMNLDITEQSLELSYLEPYKPAMMSDEAIRIGVKELISIAGRNQGAVMGAFNKQFKGQSFDNKIVSKIVQEEIK